MNDLQIFNYESKQIRTIIINEEPWWVAKDVCDILEIQNTTQAIQSLEEDERSMFNIGRQGNTNIINESGLYSLILQSRKPEAKKFKKWITSEVLPSIRKTGQYSIESDPQKFLAQAVQLANKLLEEQKPLVEFAESVRDSKSGILIRNLAKNLSPVTGEKRLYEWLRQNRIMMPDKSEPYQQFIDNGYFEMKEHVYEDKEGGKHITFTPLVTGKGQIYIEKKWRQQHGRV